eukprot:1023834_1
MFTPKRSLLVVFVVVAIGMGLTGASNIPGVHDNKYQGPGNIHPHNGPLGDPQRQIYGQTNSTDAQRFKRSLRSLILSAVMIILIILGQILACFENKNCQRAAVILNYLSTGV